METVKTTDYSSFKCIADACPDTCCRGWVIDIDKDAMEYYKTFDGDFGKKMAYATKNYKSSHFIQKDGHCPFLNSCNLCEIYLEKGENAVRGLCATYPRFLNDFGAYRERGLFLSCPVVAKSFCGDGYFGLETVISDEPITALNDIEPELFFALKEAKEGFLNTVETDLPLNEKLHALTFFARLVQKCIDKGNYADIPQVFQQKSEAQCEIKFPLKAYSKLETLSVSLSAALKDARLAQLPEKLATKLLLYFIHKYFMTAAFDGEISGKMAYVAGSVITISYLSCKISPVSEAVRTFAKEAEHSDKNIKILTKVWREIYDC